jgi:4-aminobutyrate aminotransferase-like enzyme
MAATSVVVDEKLPENALAQGNFIRESLEELRKKYPFLIEVRGRGLFLAMV